MLATALLALALCTTAPPEQELASVDVVEPSEPVEVVEPSEPVEPEFVPDRNEAGCGLGLREEFIMCIERGRAVPQGAAEDDESVARARSCLRDLDTKLRARSLAELLRLDPDDPLMHTSSAKLGGLVDEARTAKGALEEQLVQVIDAPSGELSTVVERLYERSNALLRVLQRLNALLSGRSALVVRGGVSMGTYQAGYLYYQTELLKRHAEQHPGRARGFSVSSGSSAGAINALIASLSSCRELDQDFLDSMFYRVWVGVGFYIDEGWPSLLDAVDDPRAVFSKGPLSAAQKLVEDSMREPEGWAPRCESVVGLTTTRTSPRDLAIGVDVAAKLRHIDLGVEFDAESEAAPEDQPGSPSPLSVALQEERFGFHLEALGAEDPQRPVHVENVRPRVRAGQGGYSARELEALRGELYPFAGDAPLDPVPLEDLFTIARASAAFPVAFAPERLDYGVVRADGSIERQTDIDLIDGGVFDNHPFGFAASLREWTRRPADACELADSFLPDRPTEFLFVEPTLVNFEAGAVHERPMQLCGSGQRECLLGTYAEFALGFLETSREASLLEDADELPYLRVRQDGVPGDSVDIPRRGLPIAGEQLAHFLAFFETDFRVFDFIVGLVDAERNLQQHPTWSYAEALPRIDEPRVECLRAYWAARDAGRLPADIYVEENAQGVDDVPALPQVCRELFRADSPELEREAAGDDRLRGDDHNFVALLVAAHDYMGWLASPRYVPGQEFDRYFEELDRAGFRFIDLQRLARKRVWAFPGAVKIDADRARKLVRDIAEESLHRVSRRQRQQGSRALIEVFGKVAANVAIDYRHPSKVLGLGITFGGLEMMFGASPSRLRLRSTTLRFDVGARAHRLRRERLVLPGLEREQWRMSAELFHHWTLSGPGFFGAAKQSTNGAVIQTELGAGFVLSEGLAFGPEVHRALRYGPEVALGLTVFQRLYLGISGSIWVDGCHRRAEHCLINPAYVDSNYDRARYSIDAHLAWRWLPL